MVLLLYDRKMKKRLLDRRRRAAGPLPPVGEILRGTVFVRRLRCGKATCHCAEGEGHEVTYLSVSLPGGRSEQISLPKSLVPMAKRWVRNYQRWHDVVERISAINREILRDERATKSRRLTRTGRRRRRAQ